MSDVRNTANTFSATDSAVDPNDPCFRKYPMHCSTHAGFGKIPLSFNTFETSNWLTIAQAGLSYIE
jgi:hypothetical protein